MPKSFEHNPAEMLARIDRMEADGTMEALRKAAREWALKDGESQAGIHEVEEDADLDSELPAPASTEAEVRPYDDDLRKLMGDPDLSTALLRTVEANLKKRGDKAADRIRQRVSEQLSGKPLKKPKKIDEST